MIASGLGTRVIVYGKIPVVKHVKSQEEFCDQKIEYPGAKALWVS
jgi:hypothetical protein